MSTITDPDGLLTPGGRSWPWRLWDRELAHYPGSGRRLLYLTITVAATIALYYELYVGGSVATKIIDQYGFTFTQFVLVSVIGSAVGALASLTGGLADRWGRANLLVGGLLVTGLLVEFALPNATSKAEYATFAALVGLSEGVALVASATLVRDFSPQVERGAAMGFWTMGPVLGSLLVTEISSHTLASYPDWRFQLRDCGAAGLAIWLVALLGLRELSPGLRDQLMVTSHDRALVEARATGIDPEHRPRGNWRQLLRLDIVVPALAISLFLMLYYAIVGFLVVYFTTVFGYTARRANSLGSWYWTAGAVTLVVAGVASDRLRVRKPFMVGGAVISLVGAALFATHATKPHTGYHSLAVDFVLMAVGSSMVYVAFMAAFTETVELHDPAATARGLAVWGWILRLVVTASAATLIAVVPATTTLLDKGQRIDRIVAAYPRQVRVLETVDPATLAAVTRIPGDTAARATALSELSRLSPTTAGKVALLGSLATLPPADLSYVSANATKVAAAQKDNPGQWQTWWWICFSCQILFIPSIFLLTGRWSPRKARYNEIEHRRASEQELGRLMAPPRRV